MQSITYPWVHRHWTCTQREVLTSRGTGYSWALLTHQTWAGEGDPPAWCPGAGEGTPQPCPWLAAQTGQHSTGPLPWGSSLCCGCCLVRSGYTKEAASNNKEPSNNFLCLSLPSSHCCTDWLAVDEKGASILLYHCPFSELLYHPCPSLCISITK